MSIENRVFKELHPVGVLCKWKLATWVKLPGVDPSLFYFIVF